MIELTYPFSEEAVRALKAGDEVLLNGTICTGRDRLHKYLAEGGTMPTQVLRDGGVYHCGPVVVREGDGWKITSAGPTTSSRENAYMDKVIRSTGLRIIIGKGGMNEQTQKACAELGCVYLQAVGGAAALLASRIRQVKEVHFLDEFGAAEAAWVLEVKGLPAVVGIDTHGNSLYTQIKADSLAKLKELSAHA